MVDRNATQRRPRRKPKPLDRTRLRDLALSYVARFATSAGKLETYLKRKLRERGWEDKGEPDIDAMVADFVDKGYVDDRGYGKMKAGGLLSRGYGARRVDETLRAAGLDEGLRSELAPGERDAREAALALARRRRFGPFSNPPGNETGEMRHKRNEKQLAAMVRAGHTFAHAQAILSATDEAALEEWLEEADLWD
ncbi:hypothetical protein GRI34_08545 [Erythrobacter aquimaris]|uniref:Uncharacterized protein n=1 Tax=Qipengyuania aquimaris TaxID=255984 RepID=A0A6I4TMN8_9SPHN|nr:RecX family transcriptional regulator [Qipengyuania aquimaris]MXO96460.1 hypothetical protein [Qipengyuania aquimaris]